ncbi:hypothetical protein C2G38_2173435 [Gigaspora rosea]|uniref:Uncharacterized protein n=1 Tax=Gigaspora rosea TaxID=44941 RepID=A0A397VUG5_9GLOM|nr:hypothetical protein C2G38_2173435 [Gigaspora rosea]
MQKVIDKELCSYLAEVLQLLIKEKLLSINSIDSLVASTPTNTTKIKLCPGCNMQNIKNQKRICLNCKAQLPTLPEIQKEKIIEIINNLTVQLANSLIFKLYKINEEQSTMSVSKISKVTDQKVDTLRFIFLIQPKLILTLL